MAEQEILYGRNAVRECLRAQRRRATRVMIAEGVAPSDTISEVRALAKRAGVAVQAVSRDALDRLIRNSSHQGVALQVAAYPYVSWPEMLAAARAGGEAPLLLLLDSVQDPQNLGTLLRTAEALGVHGAIIPKRRAVEVTPAVVNASSGAVEHLRIDQVSNLAQTVQRLKEEGVWVVGLEDTPEAQEYTTADLAGPLALVVGGEGQGLGRLLRERCDFVVRLPMRGHVNSLNVSVAASVALYEIERQRRARVI